MKEEKTRKLIEKWYEEFKEDSTQDFTFKPSKFARKEHKENEWFVREFPAWLIRRKKVGLK
jgi:hypothetical protein